MMELYDITDSLILNLKTSVKSRNSAQPHGLICKVLLLFASLISPVVAQTLTTGLDYLGSDQCAGCHQQQTSNWQASDHYRSMGRPDPVTVLGDFSGDIVSFHGFNHCALEAHRMKEQLKSPGLQL